jgi:competence protein ComGC
MLKRFKKQDGFTLIEMLIVLLIITVLILLIVPNLGKNTTAIYEDGCDALKKTVTAQVHAYQLVKGKLPESLDELVEEKYINKNQKTCKNGEEIIYTKKDDSFEIEDES